MWSRIAQGIESFAVDIHKIVFISGGNVYMHTGYFPTSKDIESMEKIGVNASALAADFGHVYLISTEDANNNIYIYDRTPFKWTKIGTGAKTIFAAIGDLFMISSENTAGNIYRYNGKPDSWTKVGDGGVQFFATELLAYVLRSDGSVFQIN
jgi:N-acetylneuraminic acid mutarotase